MMIWFLTRSLSPYQSTGGGQIRLAQANHLEKLGWEVKIIMPNYQDEKINIIGNVTQIPHTKNYHLSKAFQHLGIYEDYLDVWVKKSFLYLKDKIKKQDIVFATSGGELAMVKLGYLLKQEVGCKLVINFHDPISYGDMNGLRINNKFHFSRERVQQKYVKEADFIITSSQYYAEFLKQKFPILVNQIENNYFGYIKKFPLPKKLAGQSKKLRIAYAGLMSKAQAPELLYQAWQTLRDFDIEIYFIGDSQNYKPLNHISKTKGCHLVPLMPYEQFLSFMVKNIDVGFVSLSNDYYGACVPSKIYEYINLGLPMLAALPAGDGMDIINENNYGVACDYKNTEALKTNLQKFKDQRFLNSIQQSVLQDREIWAMDSRILQLDKVLKKL
jgi:glycosyltransferase involved in cell wall biosynthesis